MPVELLLLLQHQHEVVAEAALHHHPVHSTLKSMLTRGAEGKTKESKAVQIVTGQVDVGGQEDDIFALQRRDGLVHLH